MLNIRIGATPGIVGIAVLFAIVLTVLSGVFIMPAKKRAGMNKFFKLVHDLFNFKWLILENVLKYIYVFLTIFIILTGFFTMTIGAIKYDYAASELFFSGFLTMILGPVAVRIVYELLMMAILAVKNIISINNKLKNQNEDAPNDDIFAADFSEFIPEKPVTNAKFCANCGAPLGDGEFCQNCGAKK